LGGINDPVLNHGATMAVSITAKYKNLNFSHTNTPVQHRVHPVSVVHGSSQLPTFVLQK